MSLDTETQPLDWYKVGHVDDLPEGRVKTVTARTTTLCLSHFQGQWAAMDNRCPHQGGPLGEGSIEQGVEGQCWIRCPWHGWDFDPLTGAPPGGHEDTGQQLYPVEIRDDEVWVGLEAEPPHERTTTDVMAETFEAWGVRRVFGMVGHSNLGLADAIRRRTAEGAMSYVAIRHEGAASFAASAYGKLTGVPAGCLSIAGPGATNMLTGLWDAKVDRAPVLALTGQVQTQVFGPGAFQDIDLASAFDAVTRFSQIVLPSSNHAELASLACKNAIVERDVGHLIFPDDVQTISSDKPAGGPQGRVGPATIRAGADDLDAAADMIARADRPFIVMGWGAKDVAADVIALAEAMGAPVATTFKGKGLIPDTHPNAAGVLGRSGTPIASWFMNECDLILTLGSSFANHTGIEPSKPIIQVDFERMQLGKFHPVALPVWGEIGHFAREMAGRVTRHGPDQIAELRERWAIWRDEKTSRLSDESPRGLSAATLFHTLTELCPEDAIIAVDVGNNTYSFGRYFEAKGQSVLMSGYLGSIGFGFPAAMGAWAATQDFEHLRGRKVLSISGDGGFGQYAMEFTTAVRHGMNITHVLMNNGQLGKISKEQRAGEFEVWQTDLVNPSFAAFARLCGGHGHKVTTNDDLRPALEEALALDGPSLVEVMTDPELV
ncbi:thiamine pyrophosphate-dependent enzyme [Pontivivens ytuae]|uniref:Rieske 2Fe-2S domain-containing protein n=1 Tax=Pontivivens ytuae TaxID=2789856 RepID=A0A7S9QDU0_9RHOB|nr:thiamine pyrophosphate-dependent enzyme [Pontivivens ytuae]QPH54501.1 Rieske 2Fe-2S domain-containing protein [Pontivivens ytuae]